MEKQVRNFGRLLLLVTLGLIILTIGMTAQYGWNMTTGGNLDRAWQAGINGAIDVAGPTLAGIVGVCWAIGYRKSGIAFFFLAALCAAFTYQAIVGFQSSNRETLVQARENAAGLAKGYMAWATDTVTKRIADEKGKTKGEALNQGIEAVGAQVKEQIRMLQAGEIVAADGQATTFGRMFGISDQSARTWVTGLTALIIIVVSYGCAAGYGFLRQKLEPFIVAQSFADYREFTTGHAANLPDPDGFTTKQARDDLDILLAKGFDLRKYGAFRKLAQRWGWTANRTNRWLRTQADLNVPPPAKRSPRKSVHNGESVTLNGNGRAHAV